MKNRFDKMKAPKYAKFDFPCAYFLTEGATSLHIKRVFWVGVGMPHRYGFQVILSCCDRASPNRTFVTTNTTNESHNKGLNHLVTAYPHLSFNEETEEQNCKTGFKDKQ